ncbi:TolC family protein [Flavobacterium amniphilum]|uniref:TolC family protein n=1 Tax=Flavobacterium amniphilum TaxID=1834035 RepID=UPI002029D044|nr:TolC family protein [Flavobacterium amniphilum]MCL9807137.1 TolC family protein [Flavobacterium amniphilum]
MRRIFILLNLIYFVQVNAQDKVNSTEAKQDYTFSLKQAIEYAVKNNYTSINASRDIEAAKQKKWETTTMGLPQINGKLNYQNSFKIASNLITVEGRPAILTLGDYNSADAGLSLSQLIFDGSYLVGLESARTYLKISQNAQKKTSQEITELTTNAYGNVLLAEESIKIVERNKAILEKTLRETGETYKNGFLEEEAVERIQITLASVNSTLDYATRMRAIATNMLKLLMGIELNEEITLTDKLDNLTTQNIDMALLGETFSVENNIDYQIEKNVEESKRLLLKLERSKALPSLGAQVNFGYNTFSSRFGDLVSADQKWYNYSNAGIALNVPIFSSFGRSSRTQQAKIAFEQAKTKVLETEQTLKLQYQKAKSDYEYSVAQYNSAKSTLNLSERIEGKQQVKFKEGLSTSFEFTEAQRQLYTAQQDYLQAMVDIINKRAALEKIINKN